MRPNYLRRNRLRTRCAASRPCSRGAGAHGGGVSALDRARLQSARGVIGAAAASSNVMAPGLEAALSVVAGDVRKMYGKWEDFAFDQGVTAGQTAASAAGYNPNSQGMRSPSSTRSSHKTMSRSCSLMRKWPQRRSGLTLSRRSSTSGQAGSKSMLDRLLGIEEGTLSSVEALARLTDAVNAGNATLQAQHSTAEAAAAAMTAASGGGGGGGTPYKGPTYTDFMGNQVALQARRSKQFYEAVAASASAAVSSLSELRDRLHKQLAI